MLLRTKRAYIARGPPSLRPTTGDTAWLPSSRRWRKNLCTGSTDWASPTAGQLFPRLLLEEASICSAYRRRKTDTAVHLASLCHLSEMPITSASRSRLPGRMARQALSDVREPFAPSSKVDMAAGCGVSGLVKRRSLRYRRAPRVRVLVSGVLGHSNCTPDAADIQSRFPAHAAR